MKAYDKSAIALGVALSALSVAVSVAADDKAETVATPTEVSSEALSGVDKALIPIKTDGLLRTRQNLFRYIWKGFDPYKLKPSAVVDGSRTGNMARVAALAAVKTIYVNSTEKLSGFTEFAQNDSSKCLAIWAQGHEGFPPNPPITEGAASYLTKQWTRGCDVLIVPMPFRIVANAVIDSAKEGVVVVGASHEGMALIESPEFSAFRLFFDPLYASLNWLEELGHHYKTISMAGVSGGGWMSVVYPALDNRITDAISVAGSFPMYLKHLPTGQRLRDLGDWEQTYAPFYQIASYYELYLLSSLGAGRRQTLVYNMADPCCFDGARAMTFLPKLEEKARQLGLNLKSIVDSTHEKHDISESAILAVLENLERKDSGE